MCLACKNKATPIQFSNRTFEDQLFDIESTVNKSRISEFLSYPGITELLSVASLRLLNGHGKYGFQFLKTPGKKRFSARALIEHAREHLRLLELGYEDDAGSDPRHHIGAIIVNMLILNYYLFHRRDAL